jgi:hypothetical protein
LTAPSKKDKAARTQDGLVTTPAKGAVPDTTAIDEDQYTGTVAWQTGDGAAVAVLPDLLPEDYPAVDFYGATVLPGGAAGAVQAPTQNTVYLGYGANDPVHGVISDPDPAPGADSLYAAGTTVTLTATAGTPWTFGHWTVNGTRTEGDTLTLPMDAHKTVQAKFARTVTDTADTEGTAEAPTLRYALNNVIDDDLIILPANATITLGTPLPQITKGLTIDWNGATLTQSGFTPSTDTQLLYVNVSTDTITVAINRLHFKGGRATNYGGTIRNKGHLTLNSCIFSDNQATDSSGQAGALYSEYNNQGATGITIRGCTFYNNSTQYRGAVIVHGGGPLTMTGNLFVGNRASGHASASGDVFYTGASLTNAVINYNVSDRPSGTGKDNSGFSDSGYAISGGNLFSVTDITFVTSGNPTTKPSSGSNLKTLTTLPEGFPAEYFDGTPGATTGCVSTTA